MFLDLRLTFKNEDGKTIKYEFGTASYNVEDKKYRGVDKSHSEILAIKQTVINLLDDLLR